jgi:hypothetical protein
MGFKLPSVAHFTFRGGLCTLLSSPKGTGLRFKPVAFGTIRQNISLFALPGGRMKKSTVNIFLWAAIAVSILFFAIYTGRGIYLLGFYPDRPIDLWLHWCDLRYVSDRQNPYDLGEIFYHIPKVPLSGTHAPRLAQVDLSLSRDCGGCGYPPWAFFWANLFMPPVSWNVARPWFFVLNLACLVFLARFAWEASPSGLLSHRLFLMFGALAVNSIGTTLGNGQWGLVLMVLLILAVRTLGMGRGMPSGFLYAVALLKPTFVFTFAVIFLARGRRVLLLTAALLTVLASLAVGWWVKTNPLEMIQQLFAQTEVWHHIPYSLQDYLAVLGFSSTASALVSLGLALALTLLFICKRPGDLLVQMAVCGTLARVGPYHQLYDDVLMIFLLLALGRLFLLRPTVANGLVYVLIMISLCLPGRLTVSPTIGFLHIILWSCGLAWLLYNHEDGLAGKMEARQQENGLPTS